MGLLRVVMFFLGSFEDKLSVSSVGRSLTHGGGGGHGPKLAREERAVPVGALFEASLEGLKNPLEAFGSLLETPT